MGSIINGKEIALIIKEEIKQFVEEKVSKGKRRPMVASILVGNDGGSIFYMNSQEKVATSLGVDFKRIEIDVTVSEEELIEKIIELNNNKSVDGIILQLPLPEGMNEKRIVNYIDPQKDVDCLTYINSGKLYNGDKAFLPCTPKSVITLLERSNVSIEGKEIVVVGRSNIVGKPLGQLFLEKNGTVTICHSKTKNLKDVCKRADILVVAIGKAGFINKEFIKDGAVVIDVGTSSVNGKITGDVVFKDALENASLVTPVPGGVGACTTTLLIKNVCEAYEKNEN